MLLSLMMGLAITAAASPAKPFIVHAMKIRPSPVIDGRLGEDEWAGAAMATDFIQFEPHRGDPSEHRTEALIAHDERHIYVAFHAWDPDPLTAQLTQRDGSLLEDDAVIVLLDASHDRRSAYYFIVNALGAQADGRVAEDGRQEDGTWDASWQSAAARTDDGWSAELAIPLSSIQYAAGSDRTWGVNFGRSRRRSLELSFWAGPLDSRLRVSQAGVLADMDVPPPPRRFQVICYALSRAEEGEYPQHDVGVDIRYALTAQTSFNATINPDFATIEADQEEINLTRFEIRLAEKRPFFMEGQELFAQRYQTFYSRRIAAVTAGTKLLGKTGPWTGALLTVEGRSSDSEARAHFTVGRLQRDILGRSNVALQAANRHMAGENEGSVAIDTNLLLGKTFGFTGQIIRSHGRHADGVWAFFLRPAYDSPTGHFHVRYSHIGEHFAENANSVGFIHGDDDRRELDSAVEKTFWFKRTPLERLIYNSNYNVYWGQDGMLRSWKVDQSLDVDLRNRLSTGISHSEEFKRYEMDFRNRNTGVSFGYNTRQYESFQVGFHFGRNFNADFTLWTARARRKIGSSFSAEYELQRLELDPDPKGESTWIHVLRASQFFTKDLFLRAFLQTNSAIDRRNVQVVFVYRYRPPFGTLQLAYQRGTAGLGERSEQGNTLFIKATAVF